MSDPGILIIEVKQGPRQGERFEFERDEVTIGRGTNAVLHLPQRTISRVQAEVVREMDEGRYVLVHKGSVNPTLLNDNSIDRAYLSDGDVISFAGVVLAVKIVQLGEEDEDDFSAQATRVFSPGETAPASSPDPGPPAGWEFTEQAQVTTQEFQGMAKQLREQQGVSLPPAPSAPVNLAGPGGAGAFPAAGGFPGSGAGGIGSETTGQMSPGVDLQANTRVTSNAGLNKNIIIFAGCVVCGLVIFYLLASGWTEEAPPPEEAIVAEPELSREEVWLDVPAADCGEQAVEDIGTEMRRLAAIGSKSLSEWRIADDNLWTAREYFRDALSRSKCLDQIEHQAEIAELGARLIETEEKLSTEFRQLKLNGARYAQSGNRAAARSSYERVLRMIPERRDDRNKLAREKLAEL